MIDEKGKVENDLERLYEIQDIINHLNLSSDLPIHQNHEQIIIQNQIIVLEKEIIIWKDKFQQCEKEKNELQQLLEEKDLQIAKLQQPEGPKMESLNDEPQSQQKPTPKKLQKKISLCESPEDQEAQNYLQLFTTVFSADPALSGYFPLNSQSPSELPKAINDGVILCKLLNFVKSGTIDERAINNKHPLDEEQKKQNINLAISGAKSIGSMLGALNAQEILSGNQKEILNLIYQILKAGLLNTINLKDCPQLIAMKQQNETALDLAKLKPEEMLKRWLGYVMSRSVRSKKKQIFPNNFSRDLSDGECLLGVTEALLKGKWREESNEQIEKLTHALDNAEELGINNWTMPEMIVAGNPKINQIFCAQLFHGFNGLNDTNEEQLQAKIELDSENDDQTVSREERTFRMWVNSLSLPNTGFIANLFDEITDGILLLKLIDSIKPGCVNWTRVEKNASTHVIKQITNCNLAIETAKNELGLSLIGIGGKDIHDKNKKLVIALMHQLMLKDVTKAIGNLKEEDMTKWANDKVGETFQHIKSLKDSNLKNSLYLLHLLHQINPKLIDWSMVYLNESYDSLKQNAQYVISIARKLGASLFLVWEDIVELKIKMVMTLFASLKEYDIQFNA